MMDTQHLRTFVEVARQGSFAAAARRLDLATSQVTRAVAAIESELGARLMHRTTRRVTLTESGAAYFERVSLLLDQLDAAADDLRDSTAEVRGVVRITASMALGQQLVIPLLKKLHDRHPGLELDLRFSDMVVDLVGQQSRRLGRERDGNGRTGKRWAPKERRPAEMGRRAGTAEIVWVSAVANCLRIGALRQFYG